MRQRTKRFGKQLWIIKHLIVTHPAVFVLVWILTLWVFVYALTFNLFIYIITTNTLSAIEKFQFIISSFTNILGSAGNLQTLSTIVFSFVAAINIMLIVSLLRSKRKIKQQKSSTVGGLGVMIVSHCATCGTSLLAPIFTLIVGGGGVFVSTGVANATTILVVAINTIGIVLVGRATLRMAYRDYALIYLGDQE